MDWGEDAIFLIDHLPAGTVPRRRPVEVGGDAEEVLDSGKSVCAGHGQFLMMARPGRDPGEEESADLPVCEAQGEALIDLNLVGVAKSTDLGHFPEEVPAQVHVVNPAGLDEPRIIPTRT